MGRKYHKSKDEKWLGLFVLLMLGIGVLQALWPILALLGLGGLLYWLTTRQSRLDQRNTTLRLQDLKDSIARTDRQVKLLESYLENQQFSDYATLSRQLLPQLTNIREEADALKPKMDLTIYKRITTKAQEVTVDIKAQLEKMGLTADDGDLSDDETAILTLAPELLSSYRNIRMDDRVIRDKLKLASNRAELTALHEANMARFRDILQGYLKIKENPKNFKQADQRLAKGKAAIEQFDLQLDETLRDLNEEDLTDFEVSLRLMKQGGEQDEA